MTQAILFALLPLAAWGSDFNTAVDRAMTGRPGTAVVVELTSGKLLAGYRLDLARTRTASPGSTLKPFTLAAWLERHQGDRARTWACPRQLHLAGRTFDCTHPLLAAPLDPATALAYSCNCYFARLALELTPAELARSLRTLAANVSLASTPEELQMQAIGEWGIRVTPMELLAGFRRLALQPGEAEFAPLFAGLEGAVAYGSARLAGVEGLQVAGKTGTGVGHCWFAGFSREIVVVVFLEQGRGGSDAAPLAAEIFRAWRHQ